MLGKSVMAELSGLVLLKEKRKKTVQGGGGAVRGPEWFTDQCGQSRSKRGALRNQPGHEAGGEPAITRVMVLRGETMNLGNLGEREEFCTLERALGKLTISSGGRGCQPRCECSPECLVITKNSAQGRRPWGDQCP